jgi:hypothetical protein
MWVTPRAPRHVPHRSARVRTWSWTSCFRVSLYTDQDFIGPAVYYKFVIPITTIPRYIGILISIYLVQKYNQSKNRQGEGQPTTVDATQLTQDTLGSRDSADSTRPELQLELRVSSSPTEPGAGRDGEDEAHKPLLEPNGEGGTCGETPVSFCFCSHMLRQQHVVKPGSGFGWVL